MLEECLFWIYDKISHIPQTIKSLIVLFENLSLT